MPAAFEEIGRSTWRMKQIDRKGVILKIRLASALYTVLLITLLTGCTATGVRRGVMDGRTFYSTHSPNIRIDVSPDYTYTTGETPNMHHQFRAETGRTIYIHQFRHAANETQIDYFRDTDSWMFENMPNLEEFDSGSFDMLGDKWYYFNRFRRTQTACIFIRDIMTFASEHDILSVRFIKWYDWRDCDVWNTRHLSRKARSKKFQEFFDAFSDEISVSRYEIPKPAGAQ